MASPINGSASVPPHVVSDAGTAVAAAPGTSKASSANAGTVASHGVAKPARLRTPDRHPQTQVMLGRLRAELARIEVPPDSADAAHREIAEALSRARLGSWLLPALDDATVDRHGDGTVSIPLIAHVVVINPWGAFRIVDLLRPAVPYFERAGGEGRAFEPPWKASTPPAGTA